MGELLVNAHADLWIVLFMEPMLLILLFHIDAVFKNRDKK